MKTIALLNEKGGVGKTTLATHIAVGLALKGHRVLIIDADAQGNSTKLLGHPAQPAFYDLLVRNGTWNDTIKPVASEVYVPPDRIHTGALYLVPSNFETGMITSNHTKQGTLRARLHQLRDVIDYVVIDTSPQIGWLNEAVILATDYVFIPTDCERFSAFEGVPYSIDHITAAMNALSERGLYGANLVGILPNKFRTTTVLHHEVLKELKERHGKLVLNPLPLRNDIAEMQAQGQFVFHRARSSVTPQMWGVVNHVERASAHV